MEERTNELVETENIEEAEEVNESSGLGTGLAMLIGGGIALAVAAGGKKLKKVWDRHKAKKEAEVIVDAECEDPDEEWLDSEEEETETK